VEATAHRFSKGNSAVSGNMSAYGKKKITSKANTYREK
jgi:hypothetical protein